MDGATVRLSLLRATSLKFGTISRTCTIPKSQYYWPKESTSAMDIKVKQEKLEDDTKEKQKDPQYESTSILESSGTVTTMQEDSQDRPKSSKRRPHNKSRRGCATCKRRRVKCDETHPVCKNCEHLGLECSFTIQAQQKERQEQMLQSARALNLVDIRLFYHYTTDVWKTITHSGILDDKIWGTDVPMLAFDYPFLMHSILTFSATHLSRTHSGIPENVITVHRGDALNLLRQEVQKVAAENLDALVAASILLILDSLANASLPYATSPSSLPASAWLHHVRGAATILISVQPLPPESRFYELINIDLRDLASVQVPNDGIQLIGVSGLECFDEDLRDLYPVHTASPYFQTLAYLDKLYHQQTRPDFILRVFSFPAFLDKDLIGLLIQGDEMAKRVIKVYYKLVRSFIAEKRKTVWFLEGVAKVLPIDMDSEYGGLGFITSALPVNISSGNVNDILSLGAPGGLEKALEGFDAGILAGINEAESLQDMDKIEPGLTEM